MRRHVLVLAMLLACPQIARANDCEDFRGSSVPCDELQKARTFNRRFIPGYLLAKPYKRVREEMNRAGLTHTALGNWEVGHACPNEKGTGRNNGPEDLGQNLFAQTRRDNNGWISGLGGCQVSCDEADFYHAKHVPCNRKCARGEDCCAVFSVCAHELRVKEEL